jgi:predicted DsbA family dithiol-disulfide isomerase
MTTAATLKVEIWSDVVCPFCYIGKRKFEIALAQLPERDRIEVTWRSFQLQPGARASLNMNAVQHAAQRKGWPMDYARQAAAELAKTAQAVGLTIRYEQTIVANTFDAHRLAHFAASRGKGDEMMARLFAAYFTDGRNVEDHTTLAALALGIGLPADEVKNVLASNRYADEARRDIDEALQMGISGVPFFVFNGKYAVSGAQDSSVFLDALRRSVSEWRAGRTGPSAEAVEAGEVCDLEGSCE